MADEADDVLELEPQDILEEDELPEEEAPDGDDPPENEEGDEEEPEVTIGFEGDEAAPAQESDSSTIREMRRELREKTRRLAELERGNAPKQIEVGDKPTLESCEYDEEKFEAEFTGWQERKAQAEAETTKANEAAERSRKMMQKRQANYTAAKATLGVSDFDDAEAEVAAGLPQDQMALLLRNGDPKLVYALAKNPAKMAELSKLDLADAAMMIGEMRSKVKMTSRKAPQPDRPVRGNAAPASADKTLARLEKEAEASGNRTEVIRYKKKLKQRA